MKKQIFISLLIVIFFNFAIGCTVVRTQKIIPEKSAYDDYNINEVVLLNSKTIKFNEAGGNYYCPINSIIGKCTNREFVNISIGLIKQFRTSPPKSVNIDNLSGQPIKEILLKNNELIVFDQQDGFYNFNKKEISGTSENGSSISVNINNISQIYVNHPDTINYKDLDKTTKLTQILLKENNILYTFDEEGGKYLQVKAKITGVTTDSLLVTVPADSILSLKNKKMDVPGTIVKSCFFSGGVVLGFAAIIAIIRSLSKN